MFSDHSGIEINKRKSFLILIRGVYEKSRTNVLLNGETLNVFYIGTKKDIQSYHFYSALCCRLCQWNKVRKRNKGQSD